MSREKLTKNFYRDEFACRGKNCCGNSAPINMDLVNGIQMMRDIINDEYEGDIPFYINSGYRCLVHNEDEDSDDESQHPKGNAGDIKADVPIYRLFEAAIQVPQFKNGGIGLYDWGIHVDVRGHKARWERR